MPRTCVFCHKSPPEVKISNEHVLRRAIKNIFPGEFQGVRFEQLSISKGYSERFIPQNFYDFTVNDVCKTCNESWLNDIETNAENLLFPLIKGEPTMLLADETQPLATWASKTAAVRALMESKPLGLPWADYLWLMKELSPIPFTYIWITKNQSPEWAFTRHRRTIVCTPTECIRLHLTTLVMGHVVFYVLGCGSSFGEISVYKFIQNLESQGLMRLWPNAVNADFEKLPAQTRDVIIKNSEFNV